MVRVRRCKSCSWAREANTLPGNNQWTRTISEGNTVMDIFEHVEAMISAIALTVACAAVVQIIAHIN